MSRHAHPPWRPRTGLETVDAMQTLHGVWIETEEHRRSSPKGRGQLARRDVVRDAELVHADTADVRAVALDRRRPVVLAALGLVLVGVCELVRVAGLAVLVVLIGASQGLRVLVAALLDWAEKDASVQAVSRPRSSSAGTPRVEVAVHVYSTTDVAIDVRHRATAERSRREARRE